jgi:hypothetical protein
VVRFLGSRSGLALILLLGVGLTTAWGQPKPDQPAPKKERLVISVRNVPAKDLATGPESAEPMIADASVWPSGLKVPEQTGAAE